MAVVVAAAADLSLLAYGDVVAGCTKCALADGRTQVVFGAGSPNAELMFVGAAGKLLSKLLAGIGIEREEVYIANVIKCRPPGNRNPLPEEIEACEGHLFRQIELIQPKLVATLGNFATKLLSGRPSGITQVHGREQRVTLGGQEVTLYPIFHPAAALYTPRMLEVLEADFRRIPELLGRAATPLPAVSPPAESPGLSARPAVEHASAVEQQLGLF